MLIRIAIFFIRDRIRVRILAVLIRSQALEGYHWMVFTLQTLSRVHVHAAIFNE